MFHITFGNTVFNTAILIKTTALNTAPMREMYLKPLASKGFDTSKIIAFSLEYDKAKPSAACRKTYLDILLPEIDKLGIKTLLCCDGEYFKTLTKAKSAEPNLGNVLSCVVKGFEHINVLYGFNYQSYFYNPDNKTRMELALDALVSLSTGSYAELGANVLKHVEYPTTEADIASALERLLAYPELTIDIEAFSLKHYLAGIGTISFSWDKHSAIVFPVDAVACEPYEIDVWDKKDKCFKKRTAYIKQVKNAPIRALLKYFFTRFKGKAIWHNASYDVYVLIYQLWMDGLLDRKGLLEGLSVMTEHMHCTQVITYLATNNCVENKLGLKDQAHEFAGNYAVDVTDIRTQTLPDLLKYNAIDTCSTYYVWEKNYPIMVRDDQEALYLDKFRGYLVDIIDMQLTGMCLDMPEVHQAEDKLNRICEKAMAAIQRASFFDDFHLQLREQAQLSDFTKRKDKAKNPDKIKIKPIEDIVKDFNVNSGKQLQALLYDFMKLPAIDFTKTKQPATGGETLEKLINHTDNPEYKLVIQSIMDYMQANKIITTFIRAFKEAPQAEDGNFYLYGSYKLGGAVSGRLSSSNPNMQNLPSGSTFGKLIKACFIAPKGMLFGGADSASLEDRIDALLTKDPNKLGVYTRGFDGHSLRAAYYFRDQVPDIDLDDPASVNQLKNEAVYGTLRQDSKAPTFALTYQGMYITLMNNCGFTEEVAKRIEANYHALYHVSDKWKADKIALAGKQGYATVAFGLRVRTPLLHQVVLGNGKTPYAAEAEGRTVGNAFGQSYGLLNNRAGHEVMQKVRASEYALDIVMCAQIHDALYFRWKDDLVITRWLNNIVSEAMAWQDDPEIAHDDVHLSGELDIFYPSWKDPTTLKNNISIEEIKETIASEVIKRKEKECKQ